MDIIINTLAFIGGGVVGVLIVAYYMILAAKYDN